MRKLRSGRNEQVIAALDIGSHKIACLIAGVAPTGDLELKGVGVQASKGVRAGAIVDLEAAEIAILNAVHQAERSAGTQIHRVVASLTAGQPLSQMITVDVPLEGREVGDGDVRRVLEAGNRLDDIGAVEPGRELVHAIPIAYAIDDTRGIRDPRGMFGERLGVTLHVVTASHGTIRNLAACLDRCHLEIGLLALAPIAAGLACLVEDEMQLGVTLVDMGGGTTTVAVFFDGHAVWAETVPVGGAHVTNDIARGLSTPVLHAERLKTLHGSAIAAPDDDRQVIEAPAVGETLRREEARLPRSALVGIIQPRIEETLELVRARLEASGFAGVAGRRAVLTGGASQIPGLRETASLILGKQVRLGRPLSGQDAAVVGGTTVPEPRVLGLGEATSGPELAAPIGLLRFAARHLGGDRAAGTLSSRDGLFGRLGLWIKENL